ncbi:hypothetical protein [Pseudomonas sp. Irchel s3a18]|uniref:hypothetical protein n=1 Tax=Pseudomonas sp. Irchel s3a18 TaxID=2009053 RepID=UPI00117AB9C2|nr:hypothetical protein [Pseudomonas sp. Irchel s3a18]
MDDSVLACAEYGITEHSNRLSMTNNLHHQPQQRCHQMTLAEEQRKAAIAEQIRDYVYKNCHCMSASAIAEALGVSLRVIDLYYPRASR